MRILFISDIHGIKKNIDYIENIFNKSKFDKLVILGDLFNGPSYLIDYNPEYVLNFFNRYCNEIICMKGNCDSASDIKKCKFEVYKDLFSINIDNHMFYFNHGNIYNYNNIPKINDGILIYGHEHKPYIRQKENVLCINPGSISLPRSNYKESYLIYDNGVFTIYDIENNIIDEYNL